VLKGEGQGQRDGPLAKGSHLGLVQRAQAQEGVLAQGGGKGGRGGAEGGGVLMSTVTPF